MAFSSSAEYSLWPTEAPSNPTSRGQPSDIIHKSSAASQVPTNAPSNHTPRASKENLHGGVPLTSSQLLEQRQVADYQTSRTIIPIQLGANHSSLPLPVRLPPAMPSRSPTDSPERSGVESSTASNRIGRSRIQRSTSDGHGAFQSNERSQSLSRMAQVKPSRSSDSSPKPPRQSNTRNSVQTHSPSTNGGKVIVGSVDGDMKSPVGSVHCPADKPQLRRQPSVDSSESRHRRSHSADVSRGERLRRSTSNSSLNSFALDSESVKMLPNPRWGGAASSLARSRSFSSENLQSMATVNMGSNCADSFPYGSIMGTDNKNMMNSVILSTPTVDLQPRLQLTRSDASITSYSSGTSIDRSVEPVMTDMTKSAMFKGVTNKGVVKLQLPKDNFRLLSDRDLGECFAPFWNSLLIIIHIRYNH